MSVKTGLVTGGSGFVGSHLCGKLIQNGWQVHVIVIKNDPCDLLKEIRTQITVHVHDGTTENMNSIIAAVKPELIFHLASLFLSEHTEHDVERLIASNILFGTQLLEAMVAHKVRKIVNTGTSWQHFDNTPYSPVNLYAATKQAFEDILHYYVEARGVSAITLKLFDTYGSDDPRPKLFHLLDKTARDSTTLDMSPGEQLMDVVHVDDVVNAFILAAERLMTSVTNGYECYAVSSGSRISLKELVTLYGKLLNKELRINWGGRKYRDREVMCPWSTGKVLPGWQAGIDLEQGILLMKEKDRGRNK